VLSYNAISVLRQEIKPTQRIHGYIIDGGKAANIIPDHSQLQYYIRSPKVIDLDELSPRVTACFKGAAIQTGCKIDLKSGSLYMDVKINMEMSLVFERYCTNHSLILDG
jgi:metal-dependent amidase/aminoacylase/carboxypeptidase family protein